MDKKLSFKVSLGGIITALCLVAMFISGLMPALNYTSPAVAGVLLIIIVIEINKKWAFLTYISVAVLSFFITPDKEASLLFIAFTGYYPIIKSVIEQIKIKPFQWLIKIVIFNFAAIIYYQLVVHLVAGVDIVDEFNNYGKYGMYIILAMANAVFIVFDIALTRLISSYVNWFRHKIIRR